MNHNPPTDYDAIIVGAGPAGSIAAALLSQRRWRVLLVERAAWPREKACGGCINFAGIAMLRAASLSSALQDAAPLDTMTVRSGRRHMQIPLPAGAVIRREHFDAHLGRLAQERGCTFLSHTTARLLPADAAASFRTVRLTTASTSPSDFRARVVLACDGLAGTLLADEPWAAMTKLPDSRLGFAATIPGAYPAGLLGMCVGIHGYVGLVRVSDGHVHVGAALSPQACNAQHGPAAVIQKILQDCGEPELPALSQTRFTGTGPLTRARAIVAGPRVLAIGDACGYIEPFTGEGISWAIRGALQAVELLPQCAADWHDDLIAAWQTRYQAAVASRQRWCWRLRTLLRMPSIAAGCIIVGRHIPTLPASLARRISA